MHVGIRGRISSAQPPQPAKNDSSSHRKAPASQCKQSREEVSPRSVLSYRSPTVTPVISFLYPYFSLSNPKCSPAAEIGTLGLGVLSDNVLTPLRWAERPTKTQRRMGCADNMPHRHQLWQPFCPSAARSIQLPAEAEPCLASTTSPATFSWRRPSPCRGRTSGLLS